MQQKSTALPTFKNLYETLDEMLHAEGDKIDAVIVATPDWQHFNHVTACLKANKHVYCDVAQRCYTTDSCPESVRHVNSGPAASWIRKHGTASELGVV
jgi:hypothetical protein